MSSASTCCYCNSLHKLVGLLCSRCAAAADSGSTLCEGRGQEGVEETLLRAAARRHLLQPQRQQAGAQADGAVARAFACVSVLSGQKTGHIYETVL